MVLLWSCSSRIATLIAFPTPFFSLKKKIIKYRGESNQKYGILWASVLCFINKTATNIVRAKNKAGPLLETINL